MKGGRASKGAGDIYRSRTLQQTPTWTKNTQRGWLCMTMRGGHRQEFRAGGVRFPFSSLSPWGFPPLLLRFHSPRSLLEEH